MSLETLQQRATSTDKSLFSYDYDAPAKHSSVAPFVFLAVVQVLRPDQLDIMSLTS